MAVEEGHVSRNSVAGSHLDPAADQPEGVLELLALRFNPRLTVPAGLVLVKDEYITGEHMMPDLREFRHQDVFKCGFTWLQARVWIKEDDAALAVRAGSYGFDHCLCVLATIHELQAHNLYLWTNTQSRDIEHVSKVTNHHFRNGPRLPIDFELGPFAWPEVGDLEDPLRGMIASNVKQNSPLHQITLIAIPLGFHGPILLT
jgi:hypothetical protein